MSGANVHVAFGQHVDLYHSYRGDSPTADGFGTDFEVIAATLDVLDGDGRIVCDWDIECAWALEKLFPGYAPDLLERLVARVRDSRDVVRHMSWAGEMLSALTDDEVAESFRRSNATLSGLFGPENLVQGCYPQEMAYTPGLTRRLLDAGIEWVSLFYGATPFTAMRRDVRLVGADAYNPVRLLTHDGDASITVVPSYNHGDLLDFGGLDGWCTMLHETLDEDCLIYITFDADAPTWPGFLAAAGPALDLDHVTCVTVDEYLAGHPATRDVTIDRDLADGAMDGYGSWSEKPIVFRLWRSVQHSRRTGGDVPTILRAAKTTHMGLACPFLHPDRVAADEAFIAALGTPEVDLPPDDAFVAPPPELSVGTLAPHPSARFTEAEPFGDGGISFWVRVTFPDGQDGIESLELGGPPASPPEAVPRMAGSSPRTPLDAAEPCAVVLPWSGRVEVFKADFAGVRSRCTISEEQDSLSNHLTPGWCAFRPDDGPGVLVAFDERVLAAPAGMPLRLRGGELRINPFGTYWGEYPDLHPEWTGASGLSREVTPEIGEHYASCVPAFAGETLTLRLGIVPFEGEPPAPPGWDE